MKPAMRVRAQFQRAEDLVGGTSYALRTLTRVHGEKNDNCMTPSLQRLLRQTTETEIFIKYSESQRDCGAQSATAIMHKRCTRHMGPCTSIAAMADLNSAQRNASLPCDLKRAPKEKFTKV